MYGIIYFPGDHTLSTIKDSHRDLSTTSFEAGSHCVMKLGSKYFDGTIVKTGGKWKILSKGKNGRCVSDWIFYIGVCERRKKKEGAIQN